MIATLALIAVVVEALDSTRAVRDTLPLHRHRVSIESGYGYETTMWRLGTQHDFRRRRFGSSSLMGRVFVEGTAGIWWGGAAAGDNRTIVDIGVTPVWQLLRETNGRVTPYLEAAVGFHHLSDTRLNRRVGLGSFFQFGDHAGAGLLFGRDHRFDLTFRFQHLSNGGVRRPNHGVNFSSLRFAMAL